MRKTFYLLLLVLVFTNRPLAQTGLDPSFGTGGLVTTNPVFGSSHDFIHSMGIQQDGKIVVAGRSNNALTLARYNTDGSLDPAFGSGGLAQYVISSSDVVVGTTYITA